MSRPALLLLLTVLSLFAFGDDRQRETHEREEGCLDRRAEEYLRRHTQNGIIDPETRLYLAREAYESHARNARVSGHSIGGSGLPRSPLNDDGGRIEF